MSRSDGPPHAVDDVLDQDELALIEGFSAVERVLLSARGTVQSTLSALLCTPISVEVVAQDHEGDDDLLRRRVRLIRRDSGENVCDATTQVFATAPDLRALVLERRLGLGQIIDTLGLRADFRLLEAGRESGLWRTYELTGEGFSFIINERFSPQLTAEAW